MSDRRTECKLLVGGCIDVLNQPVSLLLCTNCLY